MLDLDLGWVRPDAARMVKRWTIDRVLCVYLAETDAVAYGLAGCMKYSLSVSGLRSLDAGMTCNLESSWAILDGWRSSDARGKFGPLNGQIIAATWQAIWPTG